MPRSGAPEIASCAIGSSNSDSLRAVAGCELFGVDLFQLDLAREHFSLPGLVLGDVGVELRHDLARKQLQAGTDVVVRVATGLVEQNDLIDVRRLELAKLAADGLG